MPYIDKFEKDAVDADFIGTVFQGSRSPKTPGRLAYAIYRVCLNYLGRAARFSDFALVCGVLVCMVFELYRRRIAPYEDVAIAKNGDVRT